MSAPAAKKIITPVKSPWQEAACVLPPDLRGLVSGSDQELLENLEEIRLRVGKPLMLRVGTRDVMLGADSRETGKQSGAYTVSSGDVEKTVQIISGSSVYALEEELKNGFITVPGGHRVGLAGRVVLEGGRIKTLKNISGINIRVSREVAGAAIPLVPGITDRKTGTIQHTMIFSPPRCGKTTILRDAVRIISNGMPGCGLAGQTVGLVDERSEIAGCFRGVPQRDVGIRTDVLDGCPKADGMLMLLRSMGPSVIATDEIGKKEDVLALEEVLNAGVKVIFTVHGSSLEDLALRPALKYLMELRVVERYVQLGRLPHPGSVVGIYGKNGSWLKGAGSCLN